MELNTFMRCIGWYDAEGADAAHDPIPNNEGDREPSNEDVAQGLCLCCEQPLAKGNTKTVSIRWGARFRRSYFYRLHKDCPGDGMSDKAWDAIEQYAMEAPNPDVVFESELPIMELSAEDKVYALRVVTAAQVAGVGIEYWQALAAEYHCRSRQLRAGARMKTAIDVACAVCDQQGGEECVWPADAPADHPRFHGERELLAARVNAIDAGEAPEQDADLTREAVERVVDREL